MSHLRVRCLALILAPVALAAAAVAAAGDTNVDDALGVYSGPFGRDTITLRLERIESYAASGYSEVGENRRPFSGSVTARGGSPRFELREPGDKPDDGVFRFQFLPEPQAIVGTWTPNHKKLAAVTFRLAKSARRESDSPTAARDQPDDSSARSGHTDGTLIRIETRGSYNYFVLKDKAGREQAFASIGQDATQLSYLGGPEMHNGTPMRVHWKIDTLPSTGEKTKSIIMISEGGSKMHLAPEGSAEWRAIMEAVREDYERRYKKRITIEGQVRVEDGWAGVSGTAKAPDDSGPGAICVAILRGSGPNWRVVGTSEGDEKPRKRGKESDRRPHLETLKRIYRDHPNAPVSVVGLLDYP